MQRAINSYKGWPKWAQIGGPIVLVLILIGALGSPAEENGEQASVVKEATTTTEKGVTERTTSTTEAPITTAPPTTTTAPPTTTTAPPVTAPPPPPDPYAGESVSQRNARESAASYLDYTAFSRTGLINQLKYEGFSEGDATYGVDALVVDWNEQAAQSAADYLDYTSFSRSGLVDQLIYEGFTPAQAEYGVSTTGL